nr:salicylic acid methyltransferase [Phlox sp. SAMT]
MDVVKTLHMNGGSGKASYATNSSMQKEVISITRPIREQAIIDAYLSTYPATFCIADLGCSSGPNTSLVVSEVLETLHKTCKLMGKQLPEFQVYLNDLPMNDFNNIFRSLSSFQAQMRDQIGPGFGSCFITGVPGTFYGRLFPSKSVHFVHSSYSLMWLSQVPQLQEINKRNICLAKTSPPGMKKAYYQQFRNDFDWFLKCRSQEVVKGGRMVLTIMGRASDDPTSKDGCFIWELLAMALNEMVNEGSIEEEKINSFNIPVYTPSPAEVKDVVEKEGSFMVYQLETSKVNWKACGSSVFGELENNGYNVAQCMRAVAEPLLSSIFEKEIIEEVFERYSMILVDRMEKETMEFYNVTISMMKME